MDMTTFSPALPIFLLLAALALGVWQRFSVGGVDSLPLDPRRRRVQRRTALARRSASRRPATVLPLTARRRAFGAPREVRGRLTAGHPRRSTPCKQKP